MVNNAFLKLTVDHLGCSKKRFQHISMLWCKPILACQRSRRGLNLCKDLDNLGQLFLERRPRLGREGLGKHWAEGCGLTDVYVHI